MAVDWLRKQFRFGGAATVTIADTAAATAATDEQSAARLIMLTGTLTANRSFVLPLEAGADWVVRNDTVGGFSVAVGGSSGATVTIPTATSSIVGTDGTKFFDASATPSIIYTDSVSATTGISAPVIIATERYELDDAGNGDGTREGFFTGTTVGASATTIGTISLPSSGWHGSAQIIVSVIGWKDGDLPRSFFLTRGDFYVDGGEFALFGILDEAPNAGNTAGTAFTMATSGTAPVDTILLRVTGVALETWKWRATYSITFASN